MGDELDMRKLVDMLDTALTSDDPIVRDQLRKLLMIVALMDRAPDAARLGPFAQMRRDIKELQDAVRSMSSTVDIFRGRREYEEKMKEMEWKMSAAEQQMAKSQWFDEALKEDKLASFKDLFAQTFKKGF